jgi:hypothetical protein
MFAKESAFQARRMHTRLAAQDEGDSDANIIGSASYSYLRRKTHQGKGDEPKT